MAFDFNLSSLFGGSDRMGVRNPRPPFEGLYIYFLLFFVGVLIADYGTTYLRAYMLPTAGITQVRTPLQQARGPVKKPSILQNVRDRNIFNADHFIPDPIGEEQTVPGQENAKPIPTTLPLKLLGTIIHSRRERSVASVELSGKDILAVMEEEEVEDMARIREIQRYKVIFRNLRSRKLEYIEIKEENKIEMGIAGAPQSQTTFGKVEKTNFTFQRADIDKYLNNLPQVLQDAKAVPYVAPGSGGEVSGFKMVAIKAGSIFEQLGLKRGDILKGVNGEPLNSPQKGMEMYQALKSSDNIQLEIERGGSSTTLNYQIE
jgi:general secretion pathway protein C